MENAILDIFDKNYTKKIFILGMEIYKKEILGDIVSAEQTLFLASHGNKYEIKVDKVGDGSNSFVFNKVEQFTLKGNGMCYACDGEEEGRILINIMAGEYFDLLEKTKKLPDDNFVNSIMHYNLPLDNFIIASDAFVININPENKYPCGDINCNAKFFTRCSENELKEILDITDKEKIKNPDVEVSL